MVSGNMIRKGLRFPVGGIAKPQIRHAEERPVRQEGKEQKTGDRDRPVRSPEEGRQGAEEAFEEEVLKGSVQPGQIGGRIGHHPVVE
jgi:hypothetical protein